MNNEVSNGYDSLDLDLTPEMIEAGLLELLAFRNWSNWSYAEDAVCRIYMAMVRAKYRERGKA